MVQFEQCDPIWPIWSISILLLHWSILIHWSNLIHSYILIIDLFWSIDPIPCTDTCWCIHPFHWSILVHLFILLHRSILIYISILIHWSILMHWSILIHLVHVDCWLLTLDQFASFLQNFVDKIEVMPHINGWKQLHFKVYDALWVLSFAADAKFCCVAIHRLSYYGERMGRQKVWKTIQSRLSSCPDSTNRPSKIVIS